MSCGDSELAMRNASVWCHDWELLASYALGAGYVIIVCVPAYDEQKIRQAVCCSTRNVSGREARQPSQAQSYRCVRLFIDCTYFISLRSYSSLGLYTSCPSLALLLLTFQPKLRCGSRCHQDEDNGVAHPHDQYRVQVPWKCIFWIKAIKRHRSDACDDIEMAR
jgi:hypothetical protein